MYSIIKRSILALLLAFLFSPAAFAKHERGYDARHCLEIEVDHDLEVDGITLTEYDEELHSYYHAHVIVRNKCSFPIHAATLYNTNGLDTRGWGSHYPTLELLPPGKVPPPGYELALISEYAQEVIEGHSLSFAVCGDPSADDILDRDVFSWKIRYSFNDGKKWDWKLKPPHTYRCIDDSYNARDDSRETGVDHIFPARRLITTMPPIARPAN